MTCAYFNGIGPRRGSYWESPPGNRVFPTAETTSRGQRVRGKGRGGVTKYRTLSAGELAKLQEKWFNVMHSKGISRTEAEGRIREAGGKPNYPPYRRYLDKLWGPVRS